MSKRPNRSTIELPAPMWERLRREAQVTGLTGAEIIRRAIDAYLSDRGGNTMIAHNPFGMALYAVGDAVQILHITNDRGHGSYQISPDERKRTTGYNNVITSPDGLGRIVGGEEPNWRVERDDSLTAADLETTRAAIAARVERIERAVAAQKRIIDARHRPEILATVNGPVPWKTGVGELSRSEYERLAAEWDADVALMGEVLGHTVQDLIEQGRLPE